MRDLPPNGTRVTAKRAGWSEELTSEQRLDRDPFEHASVDLEGELEWRDVSATSEHPAFRVVLVGGQEADPETVKPV